MPAALAFFCMSIVARASPGRPASRPTTTTTTVPASHAFRIRISPSLRVRVRDVEIADQGLVVAVVGLEEERGRHVVQGVPGLGVVDLVALVPDAAAGGPLLREPVAERGIGRGELGVV